MQKQRKRSSRVAGELEELIRSSTRTRLPSTRELAARFGISKQTMSTAIAACKKKGLIVCTPGIGIEKIAAPADAGMDLPSGAFSSVRLADIIQQGITGGDYRVDEFLPKTDYFVLSHGVSCTTVAKAFKILASRGITYKHGKRWRIGSPRPRFRNRPAPYGVHRAAPVIITIIPYGDRAWQHMNRQTLYQDFLRSFGQEIDKFGIVMRIAFFRPSTYHAVAPTGAGEILDYARSLGRRYQGTLLFGGIPFRSDSAVDFSAWIRALARIGRNIVNVGFWEEMSERHREYRDEKRLFFCNYDEKKAIRLALRTLADAGHTRAGVLSAPLPAVQARVRRLQEENRRLAGPLFLPCATRSKEEQIVFYFRTETPPILDDFFRRLDRQSGEAPSPAGSSVRSRSMREILAAGAPSLASLVLREKVTALIACNDYAAKGIYAWLRSFGLHIPRDISLVSFDNMYESRGFPISSINMGFGRAGYRVAHLFIGDIPIRPDNQWNHIVAQPTLANFDSIGPPGKHPIRM